MISGPFWRMHGEWASENAEFGGGSIVRSETRGEPLFVNATVVDREGRPIEGAEVDVWHASPVGFYESQDRTQANMNLRGKLTTHAKGLFSFCSVMMVGYPIPTDGVVGRLLQATVPARPPARPHRQGGVQSANLAGLQVRRSAYTR
jgi:catechol 1,2-dioxygenase